MAFRKIKGSFKNEDITTHVIEDTYLAHDTVTGQLRIGDGVTPGGTVVTTGGGGGGGSGLKFGDTTSATISIDDGGVLNLVGTGGITATVAGDTLTIDGSGVSGGGGGSADLGDLQISGSKLSVQDSSTVGVGIENIRISGNTFSIDDSAIGFIFDGHLIPSENNT